jgi:hypothetical protein
METSGEAFERFLVFVYHCFDASSFKDIYTLNQRK